jgi:hypothetical protein
MDLEAKARLRSLILTSSNPLLAAPLHSEGWRCILNDVKITLDPSKQIYKAVMGKQLQSHLHERNILPATAFLDVNWEAIDSVTSHFPPLYKLWMSKHVSGFFGMGKMMKHWQFWNHQKCPCCQHIKEDKAHLLNCPNQFCIDQWNTSVQGLDEWLQDIDTVPAVRQCIILTLSACNLTQTFEAVSSASIRPAATAQDRIGWMNFTEGKISKRWRQLQAAHYQSTHSRRTAD